MIISQKEIRFVKPPSLAPSQFASPFDYYVYQHLVPHVVASHAIAMVLAAVALVLGLTAQNGLLLVLSPVVLFGMSTASHALFEGQVPQTQQGSVIDRLGFLIKLNLIYLSGRYPRYSQRFLNKYPFIMDEFL